MYDTILVPCDGSPESERAADHALELAERFDAGVLGLFVAESGSARLRSPSGTHEQRVRRGTEAVDDLRRRAERRGVAVETTVSEGDPAAVIIDVAGSDGVDLIVMGTHGRSGVERILVGSVAERVVRSSPVPVTTVGGACTDGSVSSVEDARQVAREQLALAGHGDAHVEEPSRQRTSWVVHASDGEAEYNVHVNVASGRSRLVRVD